MRPHELTALRAGAATDADARKFMNKISEYLDSLFSLKGKTALVTGGGGGLGLIITRALVSAGARGVSADRSSSDQDKRFEPPAQ